MNDEKDFLRLLISAMEISLRQIGPRGGLHWGKLPDLYHTITVQNRLESPNAVRSFIRRQARRLGLLDLVPRDTYPGSWGILYRAAERTILTRGLQLDLFIELKLWRPPQTERQLDLF